MRSAVANPHAAAYSLACGQQHSDSRTTSGANFQQSYGSIAYQKCVGVPRWNGSLDERMEFSGFDTAEFEDWREDVAAAVGWGGDGGEEEEGSGEEEEGKGDDHKDEEGSG